MANAELCLAALFCVVISTFADSTPEQYDSCLTPDGHSGQCILISDCRSLSNLLLHSTDHKENIEMVKKALCGFEGTQSKVCCSFDNPTGNARNPDPQTVASTASPTTGTVTKQTPIIGERNVQKDGTTKDPLAVLIEGKDIDDFESTNQLPSTQNCGFFIQDRFQSEETSLDTYPWMALLEYETPSGNGFRCGGTLINHRYVLTAAHCVTPEKMNNWKLIGVRLGEYDLSSDPDCTEFFFGSYNCCCTDPVVNVGIEETIVHEQYSPSDVNQYNDIALVRLDRNIPYTAFVRPACLLPFARVAEKANPGRSALIGGWGINALRTESMRKKESKVLIKNNTECDMKFKNIRLRDSQICAFARKGEHACSGDSGGALMTDNHVDLTSLNYYILGVMSIAHPVCSLDEYPIIYSKIESFILWIVEHLRK